MDKGKNNNKNKNTIENKKLDETKKNSNKRKKLMNKGFTFVEILAVIVIIGILMSISIVAFSRYKDKAKNKDYEALAKSSYNAMEQYVMTHPYEDKASLETLVDNNLLSNRQDPGSPDNECTGYVEIDGTAGGSGNLDSGKYTVYLCCATYKKKYTYPDGTVEDYTGTDRCSLPDSGPTIPPGETAYTITYVLNGGSVSGNPSSYSVSTLPITLKNPTRSGYTFDGWTGTGLSGKTKNVVITNGSTGNRTYTANWTASSTPPPTSTHVVTLNNNGATTAGTASVKVKTGDTKLASITNPRKVVTITYVNKVGATVSGGDKSKTYTLNGWYTTAENGSKVASNASTPILQKSISGYTDASGKWIRAKNTTLYAQWAPVTATLPTITKTGSTCRWKTSDGSLVQSGGTWKFTSANSRTFTADCTSKLYTVTLNNNGATTAGTASVQVSVGDTSLPSVTKPKKEVIITYVNNTGATVSGGDYSKAYPLEGWYTTASGGSKVGDSSGSPALQKNVSGYTDKNGKWSRTSSATLYAHWNATTAKLPTITKAGYTCVWTTVNDGKTEERASGGSWKFTSANSRTFTAKCNPKKVTVTFNCNNEGKITGTSSNTGTSTYTVGVTGNKFNKTCTPSNSNMKQDGWKLRSGDPEKRYETANGVRDDWIETNSPSITIYAHYIPTGKPTCELKISNNPTSVGGWYKQDVKINMTTTGVVNQKGLATTQKSTNGLTTITVSSSGTTVVYGYVKNSLGEGTCSKTVKIDKTPPTCGTATGTSTTWTNSNRTVKQPCTDAQSGCVNTTYQKTYSTTTKTDNITISDKAGNTKNCPVNVYVDKTPPTCGTITGASASWTRSSRTIQQACTDAHSGCVYATYKKTFSTGTKTSSFTMSDKAGNTKTCSAFNVYVDPDPPSCGDAVGGSTSWSNAASRSVGRKCSDSLSGCSSPQYVSVTDQVKTKSVKVTVKDNAGNTKECPAYTYNIYLDRTAPTCGDAVGGSKSWSNAASRSVGRKCTDGLSGCAADPTYISVTNQCTTKSVKVTISDKAGNSKECPAYTYNIYLDRTLPEFNKSYKHQSKKSGAGGINEWGGYWRDTLSGLQKANDNKGSHVYYCYGTKSGCSRRCTTGKKGSTKGSHGSNTHLGDTGIANGYWLRKAAIANNFGQGSTNWDLIKMQTERNKGCQSGNYTVRAQYKVCDRANNCLKTAIKYDFD